MFSAATCDIKSSMPVHRLKVMAEHGVLEKNGKRARLI